MPSSTSVTRSRLLQAALDLFTSQGVTETTTRQIAELAHVNEVTLFRHFRSKQGLLLAVIEYSGVFTRLGESLKERVDYTINVEQALKNYGRDRLEALAEIPELLRSVVGESGKYSMENRQALGRGIDRANQDVAEYLATAIRRDRKQLRLPPQKLASLLNSMLFGYCAIELTSEFHHLWHDREDFLESLLELFLQGAVSGEAVPVASFPPNLKPATQQEKKVADLPASLVHSILAQAKKQSLRNYALAYVLFASGLSPDEIIALERSHQISNRQQHLLQVYRGGVRQVPVNQWIMGKRYGSYTRNPLNQWLKSRRDFQPNLFINDWDNPISEAEIEAVWQEFTSELFNPDGKPLLIEQGRDTWCVEMLMRGINITELSIITGWDRLNLQKYLLRSREKAALEKAISLDGERL
ncbi:MAG TPA: TetR family transcriptional regulator [Cyanobacteria bacterium UBA11149]|nr:TetR family transcriptional regulator [Cyanobacteria bacterium UBA11367]HBE56549.1 TetR family transcriptional regulator [Cyanobacteria bacterium UBA11366]HBK62356.1 TetR family transcriptional regulator [Cyanobacteria bacterium UBA11166]HBR75662.1 TetR family transcriptional regulator [Cyanobacteria bacterium UBA11159]HBS68592.1 TetR family transcriptional regulator [Cyanobacteria bacterium UBA11153]HBW91125.1 TetR family transcriptional regulator [Cyanobacteria bacterium UBA11149]HCA9798